MKGLALAISITLLCACQSPPPEPAVDEQPIRIENPALGVAIAALPFGFLVATNQGERLELERTPDQPPGRAWLERGPEGERVNLLDIVKGQRAEFEALPGGSFSGNNELLLPDGRPAYYSRGRFEDGGQQVEEFRIFAMHPTQDRLLTVFYRYPAAEDSADRLNDVLLLVGEIEGLAPAP